jgi:hypothetical protein
MFPHWFAKICERIHSAEEDVEKYLEREKPVIEGQLHILFEK